MQPLRNNKYSTRIGTCRRCVSGIDKGRWRDSRGWRRVWGPPRWGGRTL